MNNYIKDAIKTESVNFSEIRDRLPDQTLRMLHAAIGISTEAGELLDSLKKHIFYGKTIDTVNLSEELGDLFWYMAIMADAMGYDSFDRIMSTNIEKLRARYGDKFSDERAIHRDLGAERSVLERTPDLSETCQST